MKYSGESGDYAAIIYTFPYLSLVIGHSGASLKAAKPKIGLLWLPW